MKNKRRFQLGLVYATLFPLNHLALPNRLGYSY
ncbi:Uncharacterised protein [Streptococcus pyogenes]|nr:Uncharacterised protein [Streptococcus pyogenes]